jgi:hypothetical protein
LQATTTHKTETSSPDHRVLADDGIGVMHMTEPFLSLPSARTQAEFVAYHAGLTPNTRRRKPGRPPRGMGAATHGRREPTRPHIRRATDISEYLITPSTTIACRE